MPGACEVRRQGLTLRAEFSGAIVRRCPYGLSADSLGVPHYNNVLKNNRLNV